MNLDSSNAFGPDCIPLVVLKSCQPELSYILAELFNVCLKESCFPDWNSHWWSLYLKVVSATFLLVCFLCLKESFRETSKNIFYFTSKAFFVFEIIKF